jgi:hypothetical protein
VSENSINEQSIWKGDCEAMMKRSIVASLVLGLVLAIPIASFGQQAPSAEEQEPEYSFGTVKEVSKDRIVLSEYDFDTGAEKDVTYWLDPSLRLEGVKAIQEIKAGTEVDVDYVVRDGRNVAVAIAVTPPEEEAGGS